MNLLQKLLGRESKSKVNTRLDADEIKPFFNALGIDIETIGFPKIETRHNEPLMRYWTDFDSVSVVPINVDGFVNAIISGKYTIQSVASYKARGLWQPGEPTRYTFRIENNKLTIERKN